MRSAVRIVLIAAATATVSGVSAFGQTVAECKNPTVATVDLKTRIDRLTRLFAYVEEQQDKKTPSSEITNGLAVQHCGTLNTFRLGDVNSSSQRVVRDLNRLLIRGHLAYKELKNDAKVKEKNDAEVEEMSRKDWSALLRDLRETKNRVLSANGLYEPIGAVLRGGYSLADPGDEGSQIGRNAMSAEHTAAVFVEFESKHFQDEEAPFRFDYSYGGRTGFLPLMAIVQERPRPNVSPPAAPVLLPSFQNGYAWSLNGRANLQLGGSELSLVAGTSDSSRRVRWRLSRMHETAGSSALP